MAIDTGFVGQKVIPETLAKIKAARKLRENRVCHFKIQVDCGVKQGTFKTFQRAGADILIVANSGLFSLDPSLTLAIDKYKLAFMAETGIDLDGPDEPGPLRICAYNFSE